MRVPVAEGKVVVAAPRATVMKGRMVRNCMLKFWDGVIGSD